MANIYLYNKSADVTESAPLFDTTSPWDTISANSLPVLVGDETKYAGYVAADDTRALNRTLYGKFQKDDTTYRLLKTAEIIPSTLSSSNAKYRSTSDSGWHGCLLIGDEFILNEAKTVTLNLKFRVAGHASTSWGWCWTGYGFAIMAENYWKGRTANSWDEYNTDNSGIWARSDHPWTQFPGCNGAPDNYFNGLLANFAISGSNSFDHTKNVSYTVTLPAGKSHLAFVYSNRSSSGDSASSHFYYCNATITGGF